jgi:hypothetical protein
MNQVVIENPIINSPFDEPTRHFRFTDEGITNEIVDGRRTSSYFVPIAKPKKKGSKQLQFDTEWRRSRRGQKPRRRSSHLDFRHRGHQSQDRREGHIRHFGHVVFPARFGLSRRHTLSVGGVRFLAHRRNRGRHRQSTSCACRRRFDDRRPAYLPRRVAPQTR